MLTFVSVIAFIIGANVLAFGGLIAVAKFQEFKAFKAQALRDAQALYAYRVRYGAEGVEF
jgi:hypothetical protein